MIVDFHTHIFPPHVRDNREEYARRDPTFAEMYTDPKAKIATAEDLLASMEEAGVDVSVALGFAWQQHEDIVRHNDYLLESADLSGGRIIPFATVNMADKHWATEVARPNVLGAKGIGELRPNSQGWSLGGEAGERLAFYAERRALPLLFHVTEPGDRTYPGRNGCSVDDFMAFARRHPDINVIGGHLGGDCFRAHNCPPNLFVDTAAQPFLYRDAEARPALSAPPVERLLFGSDFPLITQSRQINELRKAVSRDCLDNALGGNAALLLGLTDA